MGFRIHPLFSKTKKIRASQKENSHFWWAGVDSNHRSRRRQIYSLLPLATREPTHIQLQKNGAGGRTRTPDLLITNQLLYQLSYTSVSTLEYNNIRNSLSQAFFETFLIFFDKNFILLILFAFYNKISLKNVLKIGENYENLY